MSDLFPIGRVMVTDGAAEQLGMCALDLAAKLLRRHVTGEWSELDGHDQDVNRMAIANGYRVMSEWTLPTGQRLWIITEADRSVTTFLLPDEY
jgi:hypothetical protein